MRSVCQSLDVIRKRCVKQAARLFWKMKLIVYIFLYILRSARARELMHACKYVFMYMLWRKIETTCRIQGLESNLTLILMASFLEPG